MPGVAERVGHDLRAAVVAVEARLRHQHLERPRAHDGESTTPSAGPRRAARPGRGSAGGGGEGDVVPRLALRPVGHAHRHEADGSADLERRRIGHAGERGEDPQPGDLDDRQDEGARESRMARRSPAP